MSNRAVSAAYRTVIDDVIANVRQDFEDMGIEKEVLEELQRSWEHKVLASGVADFEGAPAASADDSKARKTDNVKKEGEGSGSNKKARKNGTDGGVKDENIPDASGSTGAGASGSAGKDDAAAAAAAASGASSTASSTNGANKRKRPVTDSNEITSDLDDSDEEDLIAGGDGDAQDIMLCLYDRVQRVKNKWKVVLKDGVASIDGRDYLFSKCNGEFEW